ncbi:hypothetical protein Terro_3750 [Terriglobus roseus DSM 18391]|uniref:40-residue YVTN family beta-propeller repeat-containing protein n=1 Tax=Terriglobus roseus (strain DSM 18391 / NRRL B-41598 / KBS 63) TaxID=926566 RepID=I3ZL43_TERRK|nr:hypothetical protein [Terriglobus roseus]AFL89961.1 hypothetical protein Terro_3750 [Terriglobus roseus DSM 18391]
MQRRLLSLFVILFFAVPVGVSLSGCGGSRSGSSGAFCNGTIGPRVGDAQSIVLQPTVGGVSLGFTQTSSVTTPTATDCQGNAVTIAKYTYASSNQNIADVNPNTGSICAGQWNRNNASGIPDYTFCTNTTNVSGVAELTASGGGANSNKVLVYVHPQITAITLGAKSTDCVNDPATNCPAYTATATTSAPAYDPNTCISFNQSAQLVARFFAGSSNITYSAGHANFSAQTAGLVTFENTSGVATALAPGTTIVTATIANSTSTAGLISVCPPKTITISTPNAVNGAVTVNPNNTEPITATVKDINGVTLTGLNLTYTSTTPVSAPASSTGIAPVFPGTAAINAFCLPPNCNPSPYGNVGFLGTGKPVASNTLLSTTPGNSSTRLWIGSTDSKYLVPVDLTTGVVPSPTALPYTPNSMVLSQNGATIFMGSPFGLMTFTTASNTIASVSTTLQGTVLAVSPDSGTVVISDSTRNQISVVNTATSTVTSTFTGIGTRAAYTPDGETLYVTTAANHLLVYSAFTSWQEYDLSATGGANDVAVAIPSVGAFVGGSTAINGRSYCPTTVASRTVFYPQASLTTVSAAVGDRVASTNDGRHLLDVRLAASGGTPIVNDVTFPTSTANDGANGSRTFTNTLPTGDCPESGLPPAFGTAVNTAVLTGVTTTGITGVFPASDSSIAFTTYLPTATAAAGAILPGYVPAASGTGTTRSIALTGSATAPVSGVFSSDNKFFFTGTAGDNQVHVITRSTLTDTSQIAPRLPSNTNTTGTATPNLLVQYPRTVTNN